MTGAEARREQREKAMLDALRQIAAQLEEQAATLKGVVAAVTTIAPLLEELARALPVEPDRAIRLNDQD